MKEKKKLGFIATIIGVSICCGGFPIIISAGLWSMISGFFVNSSLLVYLSGIIIIFGLVTLIFKNRIRRYSKVRYEQNQ